MHECQTTLPQPVGGWLETAGEGKPDRMRRRPVRIIMPPAPRWRSQGPTRPLDLPNVLNTLVESVARLCEADKGVILRQSGEDASYYVAASYHQTSRYAEYLKNLIFAPGRSSVVPRVLLEGKFAAMLERAVRICEATFGNIYRWHDGALHLVAAYNTPPALAEARRRLPLVPSQHPIIDRMVTTKTASHVIDAAATSEYIERTSPGVVEVVELGGVRTTLARQR